MAAKMTIQTPDTTSGLYGGGTLPPRIPSCQGRNLSMNPIPDSHKLGDGTTAWNTLAYASDVEKVPALRWKVQGGMLYVKPATDRGSDS